MDKTIGSFRHTSRFHIRSYECDTYGQVTAANYLRYMQEAAYAASEASGFGTAYYRQRGWAWLIRETEIEFIRPLVYGDQLAITTWVDNFRRVQSRRIYELRHGQSDELVARATTNWVLIDLQAGRPVTVPAEVIAAFWQGETPPPAERPSRLPQLSLPAYGVFTHTRPVELRDLDASQHVNNAVYLAYLEECSRKAYAAYGWPVSRMHAEKWVVAPLEVRIEYKQEAVIGDTLTIVSWVGDLAAETAVRHFIIYRAGSETILARARMLQGWMQIADWETIPIPANFLADLAPHIVS